MILRKGIVLAAGAGSRLMPLTRAIPKEMIRVGLKPAIEHCIEVLRAGGITEILVIVGRKKESIMDHLGSGARLGVNVYYMVQEEPRGTADAVLHGKGFVGSDDFVVIYGDNYIKPYESIRDILTFHHSTAADVTLVLHPIDDPTRFGIVKINGEGDVLGLIEKPSISEAKKYKSHGRYLNIAGLLVLKNSIFRYLEETEAGKNDEVWLTDSVESMRAGGHRVKGYIFEGRRYDIGTLDSLLEADRLELKEEEHVVHKSVVQIKPEPVHVMGVD